MKQTVRTLGLALCLASTGLAASSLPTQPSNPEALAGSAARFDATQLEQLLGPIALYPDALIALILPASTNSSDVVLAARYLRAGGEPTRSTNENWDESVQALAHYPDIVKWMDENLAWTKQLGEAFLAQPAEVMNAVQRLRAKAQATGALTSTAEQRVVYDQNIITIVPAQPEVIYIPYYNPGVVYVTEFHQRSIPYLRFSAGYRSGLWLSYALDWGARQVCFVAHSDRERYWQERRDYGHTPLPGARQVYRGPSFHPWTPRIRPPYGPGSVRPGSGPLDSQGRTVYSGGAPGRQDASAFGPPSYGQPRNNAPGRPAQTNAVNSFVAKPAEFPGPVASTPQPPPVNPLPQLTLGNPLPQPMPSPLPGRQTNTEPLAAATPPVRNRGPAESNYRNGENRRSFTPSANGEATTPARHAGPASPATPAATAMASPPRHSFGGNSSPSFATPAANPTARPAPSVRPSSPPVNAAPNPGNNPAPRNSDDPNGKNNREQHER